MIIKTVNRTRIGYKFIKFPSPQTNSNSSTCQMLLFRHDKTTNMCVYTYHCHNQSQPIHMKTGAYLCLHFDIVV